MCFVAPTWFSAVLVLFACLACVLNSVVCRNNNKTGWHEGELLQNRP